MRVAFLALDGYVEKHPQLGRTDTGGQVVYILELARALSRQGIKTDIITRRFSPYEEIEQVATNARIVRISCGSDEFIPKEKLFHHVPEFVKNTIKWMQKNKITYSIFHSHYWLGGYAGIKLSKKLKIPHVHTPHSLGKWKQVDMEIDRAPVQDLNKYYRYQVRIAAEQKIMNEVDTILMVAETQRIKLLQHYTVDFENIKVLYPGIDTRVFNPLTNGELVKKEMSKKNRILIVSRFAPTKGTDRAVDIFALTTKKIDCHLYIATSSKEEFMSEEERVNKQMVENMITKYKLKDRVHFLGFVSDRAKLAEYYRKTDIFLLPSRFEAFGLTTMEAMACGAVTLVSRVAGSRELIIDDVNGYIVDMHERQKVAKLIERILTDKKLKNRLAQNAYLTIQKKYDWGIISKKLIKEIYAPLLPRLK